MIRKIKSSLFAKVFVLTAILLISASFLVYRLLAWFMPQTYLNELNEDLDHKAQAFISQLEQAKKEDSGGLFDRFLQNDGVSFICLYDGKGKQLELPSNQVEYGSANEAASITSEAAYTVEESAPILSGSYYFSFLGEENRYMLEVYGEAAQIAELEYSFLRILPLLLVVVVIAALAVSWLYSCMITSPVLKISRIAEEMSALKLEWHLDGRRSDELGALERSLNGLSQKLSVTLQDLQNANKKLELDIEHEKELEQAQLNFFSAASHELKTPITIIKGQLEGMILSIGAYKDREKYLARSLEIANSLETMVQEILVASRLETRNGDFQTEHFNCVPLIYGYLNEIEDYIARKGLHMEITLPEEAYIDGNKRFMAMVFSNLISNAVQYSPENGSIAIELEKRQGDFLFSIENAGDSIPEEAFHKLFDAFYRLEESRNRKTGGSGLGLYIVQKILNQHGTACAVCNTEGGVRFSFEIKAAS